MRGEHNNAQLEASLTCVVACFGAASLFLLPSVRVRGARTVRVTRTKRVSHPPVAMHSIVVLRPINNKSEGTGNGGGGESLAAALTEAPSVLDMLALKRKKRHNEAPPFCGDSHGLFV